ncbi:hypothetical protein [Sulfoacidibacillus thermotolerans]|uniref:Uncharacterized protein n=1 Tax=Sulfoacidibacillus thermotolerans TaxID=1765684 RepID=A0A2U3D6T8_SULT2|nr:hypothetical protein [Sulfoacidibacillus thermotolerans]PWI56999.1 hypothetical protein BM613_10995 [Sulfoacidibacillus thermotolerans]
MTINIPYFQLFKQMRAAFLRWRSPLVVRESLAQGPAEPLRLAKVPAANERSSWILYELRYPAIQRL